MISSPDLPDVAPADLTGGPAVRASADKALTVGVFDSGIGGFTVAGAILKRRPDLNLVYYADSINLPYGGRRQEQLVRYAHQTIEFLLENGVDMLAVGCHSSNSALGEDDLSSYSVPVYDLVASTVAFLRGRPELPQRLTVLATEATVRSGYWERKLGEAFPQLHVDTVAAPELVPLIEAPAPDPYLLGKALEKYLRPLVEEQSFDLLLGCTHYPLIKSQILDYSIYFRLVDPGQCLADQLAAALPPPAPEAAEGQLRFFNSLPSERFYELGERVFGRPIRSNTRMYIVNPHED